MSILVNFLGWLCGLKNATFEWLRGWPQTGMDEPPPGYKKVYLPPNLIPRSELPEGGGTWSDLEDVGVVRLADDWAYTYFRPVALPPGWSLTEHLGYMDLLRDRLDRVRAEIRYDCVDIETLLKHEATITLVGRYYTVCQYDDEFVIVGRIIDRDTGHIFYTTPEYHKPFFGSPDAVHSQVVVQARKWMDDNHPCWWNTNYHRPHNCREELVLVDPSGSMF